MKTLEYSTQDKSDWGPGDWQDEPDKMQFLDEETGLPCLIVRAEVTGALCGYVGVSPGHPWYEEGYSGEVECELEVHGGLTFSSFCEEEAPPDKGICHIVEKGEEGRVWWFGFDCAHCWDVTPAMSARLRNSGLPDLPNPPSLPQTTYKTVAFVKGEIRELAKQLKEKSDGEEMAR